MPDGVNGVSCRGRLPQEDWKFLYAKDLENASFEEFKARIKRVSGIR
jgi:hypothetical protein